MSGRSGGSRCRCWASRRSCCPRRRTLDAFTEQPGYLLKQAGITTLECLEGFGIAVVVGVLIGAFLVSSRLLRRTFLPLLVAANAAPKAALMPMMAAWLGFGTTPKLVMAFLLAVFPVVMATSAGLNTTPSDFIELGRALDVSRLKSFLRLRLPHALAEVPPTVRQVAPPVLDGSCYRRPRQGTAKTAATRHEGARWA